MPYLIRYVVRRALGVTLAHNFLLIIADFLRAPACFCQGWALRQLDYDRACEK